MKTLNVLYHLTLADFFERTRRYGFLLTLAAIIAMGVLVNNGTLSISLGSGDRNPLSPYYRGVLNSAWIGTLTVMVTNMFLGLFGFYLVSDCIKRDIHTGVGQIIAATPVRRATYLVGKWLSNFVVLSVLVLILAVAAVIMVLLQSRTALDLGALLTPFLAVALPYMALVAALAVVFESVPWLRGAVGNVVYFFVWLLSIMVALAAATMLPSLQDPLGYNLFSAALRAAATAAFPNDWIGSLSVGSAAISQIKVFNWSGLDWTPGIVAVQWLWAVLGFGLILLSALWFARFDPSREGFRRLRAKPEEAHGGEPARPRNRAFHFVLSLSSLTSRLAQRFDPSPFVSRLAQANPFLGVLMAELRLLFNGRRWWWWAITIGLNIVILTSAVEVTRSYLLPAIWLWPLVIWSAMGSREKANNTYQMVFSSSRPVLRQLPAAWLAGAVATALIEVGVAAFCLLHGDLPGLAGWAVAVLFVPTLALALGVVSSGSRVFEVAYVIWWYLGPVQQIPGMNYMAGAPQIYLPAAAGLLLLAAFWRGRQVRV